MTRNRYGRFFLLLFLAAGIFLGAGCGRDAVPDSREDAERGEYENGARLPSSRHTASMPRSGRLVIEEETLVRLSFRTAGARALETSDASGGAVPVLELRNRDGDVLAQAGGDGDPRIVFDFSAGEYYLLATCRGTGTGTYTLHLAEADGLAEERAPAADMPPSGRLVIERETLVRLSFRTAGARVLETSDASGGADPLLELRDSNGNVLAVDDDGAGFPHARISFDFSAGEYYVLATYFGRGEYGAGTYTLSLLEGHALAEERAPAADMPPSGRLVIERETLVRLSFRTAGARALETSDASGGADPLLELRDSNGNTLAWDDDGAGYPHARIRYDFSAGEYYVLATFFGGGAGTYTLSLVEIP